MFYFPLLLRMSAADVHDADSKAGGADPNGPHIQTSVVAAGVTARICSPPLPQYPHLGHDKHGHSHTHCSQHEAGEDL